MAAYGLDHPSGVGELPEPFVDPGAAFAGGLDQIRHGRAARPAVTRAAHSVGVGVAVAADGGTAWPGRVFACLRPSWRHESVIVRVGADGELARPCSRA